MDGPINDYGGPWEYHPGQEEQDHNLEPSEWAAYVIALAIGLEVCIDCAMLIANGETPSDNPDFDLLPEWDDYHVVLNCPEDGCEGFSWSACGGCGSRLAGGRHSAVAIGKGEQ